MVFDCCLRRRESHRTVSEASVGNFGVFEIRRRKPRRARNPKTGETVSVPARAVVTFKPGREMAERVARLGEGPEGAPDGGRAATERSTTGGREAT
jgi:hypothetical protein